MLTCRRASERLSRALDGRLAPGEKLGLWAHLLLCGPCCRYRKQLRLLDQACRDDAERPAAGEERLGETARARIAAVLDQQFADGG
jgi:hypothetical protein